MKENCKRIPLLVIIFFVFIYSLIYTNHIVEEILSYTRLFIQNVFPTSFLFFVLSSFLVEYSFFQLFPGIPLSFYFFLLSIFSGFPAGILQIVEAYHKKRMDLKSANQFVLFCHFPNPIFVFYTVSSVFSRRSEVIIFYGILLFSNFILFLFHSSKESVSFDISRSYDDFSTILSRILFRSFRSILLIYGISLVFYLISIIICPFFSFSLPLYVFLKGVLDMTSGVLHTSLISNAFVKGIFLYFFVGFGSLSIQFQIKSILSDTPISYHKFLQGRALSFLLCIILWVIYRTTTIFGGVVR